jgi:hypothetical protein
MSPRKQGDLGELSAIDWLGSQGYALYLPLGHSPDVDLMAFRARRRWTPVVHPFGARVRRLGTAPGWAKYAAFEIEPGRPLRPAQGR